MAGPDLPLSVDQTAHRDALYQAVLDVRRDGGPAAGPDGVPLDRLSGPEAGLLVGELSARLRDKTYRPGSARAVSVPKGPGRPGARRLAVGGVADRAVARTLLTALTPAREAQSRPSSYGFPTRVGVNRCTSTGTTPGRRLADHRGRARYRVRPGRDDRRNRGRRPGGDRRGALYDPRFAPTDPDTVQGDFSSGFHGAV